MANAFVEMRSNIRLSVYRCFELSGVFIFIQWHFIDRHYYGGKLSMDRFGKRKGALVQNQCYCTALTQLMPVSSCLSVIAKQLGQILSFTGFSIFSSRMSCLSRRLRLRPAGMLQHTVQPSAARALLTQVSALSHFLGFSASIIDQFTHQAQF